MEYEGGAIRGASFKNQKKPGLPLKFWRANYLKKDSKFSII